jgi:hypothetical protein
MLLAAIPSFPRPVLARLTERLIDRLDELTADADLEEEPDHESTHDAEAEQTYD